MFIFHYTGCRTSECLEVSPERVLLGEGTIIVRSLKKRKYDSRRVKKKPQFRAIPVPRQLINDLNFVFDIRKTIKSKRGVKGKTQPRY